MLVSGSVSDCTCLGTEEHINGPVEVHRQQGLGLSDKVNTQVMTYLYPKKRGARESNKTISENSRGTLRITSWWFFTNPSEKYE